MAPVAAAAIGATIAGSTAVAWTAGGFSVFLGFSMTSFLSSVALSGISMLLKPKPKKSGGFDAYSASGLTQQFRQAVTPRFVVYGECRVSGMMAYVGTSANNQYLNMVITLATHEITAIDEIIINDESIPPDFMDAGGNITTGTFANLIRIKTYLGTADQAADTDLIAETSEWTTAHRLRGIAYIYARIKWDRDKFPSGIPNFSAWVRGKKVLDTRELAPSFPLVTQSGDNIVTQAGDQIITQADTLADRKYSPNAALLAFDNLTDADWGIGASFDTVDDASADAAANLCDEIVTTKQVTHQVTAASSTTDILTLDLDTLQFFRGDVVQFTSSTIGGVATAQNYYVAPYQRTDNSPRVRLCTTLADAIANENFVNITSSGTGTLVKIAEPRYHGGGVLKMDAERGENLKEILTAMSGKAVKSGGLWFLHGLAYQTPTEAYDESDLIGNINVQTKASKRERFNKVQGVYISQINGGNPSDYPVVQSTTYQADDGEVIPKKIDLAFTQRPQTAQRIAKIIMEFERQEIKFTARFCMTALKLKAGDTFLFSFARYGWTNKVFEVMEWSFGVDTSGDAPVPYVDITAKETASAVYDFTSATDETLVDPAPNTTLPNAFTVTAVTGFSLDSIPITTLAGDTTYKVKAAWDLHPDYFVSVKGQYEIQYKLTADTTWSNNALIDGGAFETDIFQAQLSTTYDVRIRAINSLGVRSSYSTLTSFVVGSSAGIAGREDWENTTQTRNLNDWESGTYASESWE